MKKAINIALVIVCSVQILAIVLIAATYDIRIMLAPYSLFAIWYWLNFLLVVLLVIDLRLRAAQNVSVIIKQAELIKRICLIALPVIILLATWLFSDVVFHPDPTIQHTNNLIMFYQYVISGLLIIWIITILWQFIKKNIISYFLS